MSAAPTSLTYSNKCLEPIDSRPEGGDKTHEGDENTRPTHGRRQRTGFFGGTFNPIHCGHIALARELLRVAKLDEIWFVVSPLNPFKQASSDLLPDHQRLLLAQKALADEPHLVASDYEFHLPRPSFTWKTLSNLAADYPDREFVLIIGADNWLAFDRWAEPQYILAHHPIVVYPREGSPIDPASLPATVSLAPTPLYPISSTLIRQRVRQHLPITGLVPREIEAKVVEMYG